MEYHLVLASNSPRRKQLLALGGWKLDILSIDIDERPLPNEPPEEYVLRMAESKALSAAEKVPSDAVVISADTIVVDTRPNGQKEILGKPVDAADAQRMLKNLRARTHQVYTAIAVLRVADGKLESDYCATDVPMRNYSDEEIEAYIASGDPFDKAGAYAIQHPGFHPVENLQGCYANVVGLPLCYLERILRKFDIRPEADIQKACQAELGYECPIHQKVLREEI